MLQDQAEAELLKGLVIKAEGHGLRVQLGQRIGVIDVAARGPGLHRIEVMVVGIRVTEADAELLGQLIVGTEGVGVACLANEGRAQEAAESLHLQVVITGGQAIGRVDGQGERTSVGEADTEGQRVTRVLEVGQGLIREVHEGTLGRDRRGKRRVLSVFEQEARGDHPARGGRLGGARVKVIGDFEAGSGVEVDIAVVADLDERRRRNPVSALDQGGSGKSRGSDEEAGHRGGLGLGQRVANQEGVSTPKQPGTSPKQSPRPCGRGLIPILDGPVRPGSGSGRRGCDGKQADRCRQGRGDP